MPAHTRLLRTLGLKPEDNLLAANLVVGGDMAAFELLSVVACYASKKHFFELIRLFDGYHLYGADIYRLLFANRERDICELRDSIFRGPIVCSHCGIYLDPDSVLEKIYCAEESLRRLSHSLPTSAFQSPEARVVYTDIQLLRFGQIKGSREFFSDKYGEVPFPHDIMVMMLKL